MKNTGTLAVTLPSQHEISLTRAFRASRQTVHEAFQRPEILKQWFGPRGWSLTDCEIDLRVGGGFHFHLRGPGGQELGMRGVYRELSLPERSVHVESFDQFPGESVVTAVLTEHEGVTTLQVTILYPTPAARDAALQSGMEHGAAESYDRLAELLIAAGAAQ